VASYHGRLELTWTNKDLCLLAQDDGSYEWLSPSDYRVAEVRLLNDVGQVGDIVPGDERACDNLLIRGDALHALTSLVRLPEFEREYAGKVKLIYIDPPFNTQQSFLQYDDALEHSVWLTMMRDRLVQAKTLLAPDGSIWVHCDDSEMAYLRVMMDELFGRENFVGNIIWEKLGTRENRTDISTSHDYIIIFAVARSAWKRNLLAFGDEQLARYENPDDDQRGPWASLPMHAKAGPGRRKEQFYTVALPSGKEVDPPPGRCWLYTKGRFEELVKDKRIWFGPAGDNVPRVKTFLHEVTRGLVPKTLWLEAEVGDTAAAKGEVLALLPAVPPFATPKPETLLQRIIHIATNPGDVVLDYFLGSGTTAAVAHKMGRRWVGIERSADTVGTYAVPRLTKVVDGADSGGVTSLVAWEGGGGFRVLEVGPSMFSEEGGQVFLSEWATNGKLAEGTAAQLRFDYVYEPPFCGRRGRSRLAVVDGLVNEDVVRLLLRALAEDEQLVVCGIAVDPAAREALRAQRPGSTVRKIPQSMPQDYRQTTRWARPEPREASADGSVAPIAEVVRA